MKNTVCKCGSSSFFTDKKGNAVGLYCKECGKWQKWLNKDEQRLVEHGYIDTDSVQNIDKALLDRFMQRIEDRAIKVSTVSCPHKYMRAVGTHEIKRILNEEFGYEE